MSVVFSPRGAEGNAGGGSTDVEGRFSITTGGAPVGSGALAGEYDVLLSKVELEEFSYEEGLRSNRRPKATYIVPQKYGDAKTSGIEPVIVEKGGKKIRSRLSCKRSRRQLRLLYLPPYRPDLNLMKIILRKSSRSCGKRKFAMPINGLCSWNNDQNTLHQRTAMDTSSIADMAIKIRKIR